MLDLKTTFEGLKRQIVKETKNSNGKIQTSKTPILFLYIAASMNTIKKRIQWNQYSFEFICALPGTFV